MKVKSKNNPYAKFYPPMRPYVGQGDLITNPQPGFGPTLPGPVPAYDPSGRSTGSVFDLDPRAAPGPSTGLLVVLGALAAAGVYFALKMR